MEKLHKFLEWAEKAKTKSRVAYSDAFFAGWEASEASRGVDHSMVLVDLQDFVKVAQKLPNVIGRPIYYAQWPTEPRDE